MEQLTATNKTHLLVERYSKSHSSPAIPNSGTIHTRKKTIQQRQVPWLWRESCYGSIRRACDNLQIWRRRNVATQITNAVRDMLAQLAIRAKRVVKTEEKNLLNDGTARKPADVSIDRELDAKQKNCHRRSSSLGNKSRGNQEKGSRETNQVSTLMATKKTWSSSRLC
jgi:hypothetical protein